MSKSERKQNTDPSNNLITRIFCCSTIEQCHNIQRGNILFRRVGKWIALCSIGITFSISHWINHFKISAITYIQSYDQLISSKPIKWFYEAPSIQWIRDLIKYYNYIDRIQTFFLIAITVLTVRWVYADAFVRGNGIKGFWIDLSLIMLANFMIYQIFSSLWFYKQILEV